MDFEEFLMFYHVLHEMASNVNMTLGEFLFPGLVKRECVEEVGPKNEDRQNMIICGSVFRQHYEKIKQQMQ